jgi:hypothetical protein
MALEAVLLVFVLEMSQRYPWEHLGVPAGGGHRGDRLVVRFLLIPMFLCLLYRNRLGFLILGFGTQESLWNP